MEKVNLAQKFSLFNEQWSPKIVGELNGQQVKLAKLQGSFMWHHHEEEDELFYVVKGFLKIELRDKTIELQEGEFFIVPRGVEHLPVADKEVWVLLFEPASTLNTGNTINERTKEYLEQI
ncbi:MAG: cupin domain-containing protein [Chitinophagaceae bacterium]